jgi:simple sugar transport system permease protein
VDGSSINERFLKLQYQFFNLILTGVNPFLAILLALLVSAVLIISQGANPVAAYVAIAKGSFGSVNAIANTAVRTSPLLIGGLGIALGIRAGLFNIGAEGQLYVGAAFATAVGITPLPVPAWLHILLAVLAGILGGALMAAIPAYLRAFRGVSEVVVTIMLNYVGIHFISYLVEEATPLSDRTKFYPMSPLVQETAQFPRLIPNTNMHLGIVIGIILGVVMYVVLKNTPVGFRIRMIGGNPEAARYAGVNARHLLFFGFLVVGGFSGLMGASEILGLKLRLYDHFSSGLGFAAISVALLAGANPIGVIITAFFFGALSAGAGLMQQTTGIESSMADVIQALVILFIVGIGVYRRDPLSIMERLQRSLKEGEELEHDGV